MTSFDSRLEPFDQKLALHGLKLTRDRTHTLQVNIGHICDLSCWHCHLESGPQRSEVMTIETMKDVIDFASRVSFETIDITGGAPELAPRIEFLLGRLAPLTGRLIVRTNLVALQSKNGCGLMRLYRDLRATVVASLPSTNAVRTDSQRGQGVWDRSIAVLKELNSLGYGQPGTGLELDLVTNPAGAFLPDDQMESEKKYKHDLQKKGIVFSTLFTFANVPLGRFRAWLEQSGNLESYMRMLVERFNPGAIGNLMCRSLISVSFDGYLYDCDFNIAAGLHHGESKVHVSRMEGLPEEGAPVQTGCHCYACAAGSGFT